jgi:hypothetical protein
MGKAELGSVRKRLDHEQIFLGILLSPVIVHQETLSLVRKNILYEKE